MKSKIRFKTNISHEKVIFFDTEVAIEKGFFYTNLQSKSSNAHLYLNPQSCRPPHNALKGQLIRICAICSNIKDYTQHGETMMTHFLNYGRNLKSLKRVFLDVKNIIRHNLFQGTTKKETDSRTKFACTWHPKLWYFSAVLRPNFKVLQQDPGLFEIFTSIPKMAFHSKKNIWNFVTGHDTNIANCKGENIISSYGRCKLYHNNCSGTAVTKSRITKRYISDGKGGG